MRLKVAALLGIAVLLASYAYFSPPRDKDSEAEPRLETAPKPAREAETATRRGLVVRENPIVLGRAFDDDVVPVVIGLRNTGSRVVRINRVAGSCGCMRAGPAPASLAPGEEAEIRFTLKLAGLSGRISKTVRVSSDDATKPELRVRIEAEVSPRLVVKPRHAVVPVAEAGAERTVDLIVDSGSGESLAGLTAVSSVPGVAVTTTVEGASARLHVSVPPEIPRASGTITLRLGKHEKVLGLTDASAGGRGLAARPGRNPRAADPRDAAETLDVVFTGGDRGQMEPCGCTGGMLGGLSRRHARIQAFLGPGVPFVVLSGGGLVTGGDEYDRLRFDAIVEALGLMGFAAIAPTRREIALGAGANAAPGQATPSFVATDVDAASAEGKGLVGELRLDAGEGLLYVCGIAGPGEDGEPYPDPRNALRKLREDLSEYVPIVILANVGEDVARDLARSAGRPTLVLYASGVTDPGAEDVEEGPLAFAPFPAEGKYVGLARLKGRPGYGTWSVEYRPVESELPEDEAVVELRKAHLGKLRAADLVGKCAGNPRFTPHALSGEAPPPASEEADRFAGSASCAECHEEESRSWAGSRHARAMESLRKTGDDADPGCVACHAVGYGTGKGFAGERATPHFAHVGCESCHGPRGLHVDRWSDPDRKKGESESPKGHLACLACHDGKHDPDFDFETYWPRIAHGAAK